MEKIVLLLTLACANCSTAEEYETATTNEVQEDHPPMQEEPTLPQGCVKSLAEIELPYYVNKEDERLLLDQLIVVRKKARRVLLFSSGELRHDRAFDMPNCWRVGLGPRPVFDKVTEGDGRTPEGWFRVGDRPQSSYYHALMVHYPGERHAKQALTAGRITNSTYKKIARAERNGTIPPQDTDLGSLILIHGGGSSSDWTAGCVALNNADIDELRSLLPKGMKTWLLILP